MTPTPDPPLAVPLTAEEIAEINDQRERYADLYQASGTIFMALIDWDALWSSHAALRDRLARAEARCVALEGFITRIGWGKHLATLLATPTDGAARDGER